MANATRYGRQQRGRRAALVVSNDLCNKATELFRSRGVKRIGSAPEPMLQEVFAMLDDCAY